MTNASPSGAEAPPNPPAWRREPAPLVWIGVGLACLLAELVGMTLLPPNADEEGRAFWVIGAALLHATAILLGTLFVITLPRDRSLGLRRIVTRISVVVFGFATLASHGWALWVIFARVHAPSHLWLRLDPILDIVGGLYVAAGWLVFLALLTLAARIGRFLGDRRDPI